MERDSDRTLEPVWQDTGECRPDEIEINPPDWVDNVQWVAIGTRS